MRYRYENSTAFNFLELNKNRCYDKFDFIRSVIFVLFRLIFLVVGSFSHFIAFVYNDI